MNSPAEELIAAGNAAYSAGKFAEAIDIGRRAVAADPRNPWAHNLLGAACAEEMELEESHRAFAAAAAANSSIAISHLNLAYALILAGAFADAEAHLNAALQIEPDMAGAFLNLSWIRKAAPGDEIIGRLETLRRRAGSDPQSQILYSFALGKWYDDVGEFDLAFQCVHEGNKLSGVKFNSAVFERHFGAIRSILTKPFMDERRGAGHRNSRPVFIVGMPRCGSSLLEDRLARHPSVAALGERPEISRILAAIGSHHPKGLRYPDWAPDLPLSEFARFGQLYVEKVGARFPQAERLLDKNLLNFQFAALMKAMLPDATIIHCRRDPIDTCLSCYFQNLRPNHAYKFSLTSLGFYYRLYADLMAHWSGIIPDIAAIDYEAFVSRPDDEYGRILSLLKLPNQPLSSKSEPRQIQTSSAFQARQPVTPTSIGRWRNSRDTSARLSKRLAT